MTSQDDAYQAIKRTQEALSLPDSDTELVIPKRTKQNQKNLDTYERLMRNMMQDHALSDRDRQELDDIRELLHLSTDDVREVEQRLTAQLSPTDSLPTSANTSANTVTQPPASLINSPSETPHPNAELSPNLSGVKGQVLKRKLEMDAAANALHAHPPISAGTPGTAPATQTEALHDPQTATVQLDPAQAATAVTHPQPESVEPQFVESTDGSVEPADPAASDTEPAASETAKPRRDRRPLAVVIGLIAGTLGILGGAWFAASNLKTQPAADTQKSNPKTAQQYLLSGTKKNQQGQYDAAVKDFDQAIQANPEDKNVYVNRGLAYYRQGNLSAALNDYGRAIALNSKFAEAFNNRSHIYYEQKKFDDAQRDAEEAIKLKPGLAEAHINLGNAQFAKGDLSGAQKSFNQAIQLNPIATNSAKAYNARGNVHAFNKSFDPAIRDYDQAIQRDPSYADAYYNRGLAFQQKDNGSAALQDFRKASELYQAQGKADMSKKAKRWVDQLQPLQQNTPSPSVAPQPQQTAI